MFRRILLYFFVMALLMGCITKNRNVQIQNSSNNPGMPTLTSEPANTPTHFPTQVPSPISGNKDSSQSPSVRPTEAAQVTPELTSTPDHRKTPKYWAEWPLIPTIGEKVKQIFKEGLKQGNDLHSFSAIGDCQSQPPIFMGIYDTDRYSLPEGYEYLQRTIDQFKGSFNRTDVTVRDGQSVASVLNPLWADPKICHPGEMPLDCEFRIHKPIIVFINLGTNWKNGSGETHEEYMDKIVDYVISKGAVPVISSKGDNLEGDQRINLSNARVAYAYNIPFWNFWLSIRDLPGKGLDGTKPGQYLTPAAWNRRSFTGLQTLDAVWKALKEVLAANDPGG